MKENRLLMIITSLFLSVNGAAATAVSAVDYSEVVSFTDTEKFNSFQVYEDINGVFEKEGSKQINKDRDLVLLYNEEPKQMFILHKEPAVISVRNAKPEAKKVIADFISDKGISAEKIEISGYPNIVITSSELDVITRHLADELCTYLTEKEYISEFFYREQCYFASELATSSIDHYTILDLDDVRKIKEIASEINMDADVVVELEESDLFICKVSIKGKEGVKPYIDLAEAVHKELGYHPMYGVYSASPLVSDSADEITYSGKIVSSVPGDIILNNSVDTTDLTALSLALIGDISLNDDQLKSADVDGDGKVTIADLARLRQYISKVIESLM